MKKLNASLIKEIFTSWHMSHFIHAIGIKIKSIIAQKIEPCILYPIIEVQTHKIV